MGLLERLYCQKVVQPDGQKCMQRLVEGSCPTHGERVAEVRKPEWLRRGEFNRDLSRV